MSLAFGFLSCCIHHDPSGNKEMTDEQTGRDEVIDQPDEHVCVTEPLRYCHTVNPWEITSYPSQKLQPPIHTISFSLCMCVCGGVVVVGVAAVTHSSS